MSALQIGGSSIGYDTSGLLALIVDINADIIPSVTQNIISNSNNVRTTIDSV